MEQLKPTNLHPSIHGLDRIISPCRNLILAGVPEQVNIPILICKERRIFEKYGLSVVYKVIPEGTGAMLDALENKQADVAITVTDGLIAGISKNRKVKMIGTYVESPLIWAVASSDRLNKIEDLKTLSLERKINIGISRLGSGSQTMAYYMASCYNIDVTNLNFVIANNITGLREKIQNGETDCFLWENFTTKPYFDSGELTKIGEVPTPWTAFSFAISTDNFLNMEFKDLVSKHFFPALAEGVRLFLREATEAVAADKSVTNSTSTNNDVHNINLAKTSDDTLESSHKKIKVIDNQIIDKNDENFLQQSIVFNVESKSPSLTFQPLIDSISIKRICQEHGHKPEDALSWMKNVKYCLSKQEEKNKDELSNDRNFSLDTNNICSSVDILKQANIIPNDFLALTIYDNSN